MKKCRGKRLVAYIIAFAIIFSIGMTELSPIAEAAQYTILETDVSAPSTGCTMFGVYGTYYVDAQNALNRINEIRKEACDPEMYRIREMKEECLPHPIMYRSNGLPIWSELPESVRWKADCILHWSRWHMAD